MKEMQFSAEIDASKETVWATLWQDETFRQWAGIIDPGTYMVGGLKKGNEIQFISSENGHGVTSLVEELTPGESLVLRHSMDTQSHGALERTKEWAGGKESYFLAEKDGVTTLKTVFDVPVGMEEFFSVTYPKALAQVKLLAEKK